MAHSPPRVIDGERFDSPLVMHGTIEVEPQRYIAEKPYELTKFEFTILRKPMTADFWFTLVAGATVGIAIAVAGKALAALLEKKAATFESWEIWAVGAGILASLLIRFVRGEDDKEREQLKEVIEGHFTTNRPRRVHLTTNQEAK